MSNVYLHRSFLVVALVVAFYFQATALVAHAANYSYTCTDWTMNSTATCTGTAQVNFFTGGSNQFAYNSGAFTFTPGTTYYIVANTTGSTGSWVLEIQQGSGNFDTIPFASGEQDFTFGAAGGGDPNGIVIKPDPFGGVSTSQGSIVDFCISDVSYADCGGSGPTPPTPSSSSYNCVRDASSSDCLIQVVDNPNLDFWLGVFSFLASMYGMIWLFRKRT